MWSTCSWEQHWELERIYSSSNLAAMQPHWKLPNSDRRPVCGPFKGIPITGLPCFSFCTILR